MAEEKKGGGRWRRRRNYGGGEAGLRKWRRTSSCAVREAWRDPGQGGIERRVPRPASRIPSTQTDQVANEE